MQENFQSLLKKIWTSLLPANAASKSRAVIVSTVDGFSLAKGAHSVFIRWCDIEQIAALKRDIYSADMICLVFSSTAGTFEIDEQMDGWTQIIEELPNVLNGTLPLQEWYGRVAFPAFETNSLLIYSKAD